MVTPPDIMSVCGYLYFYMFPTLKYLYFDCIYYYNKIKPSFYLKKYPMLEKYESRVFSQNGEDGIINYLINKIGTINKFYVEIGTENGESCNTRNIREYSNFNGIMIDSNNSNLDIGLYKEFVTSENINELFIKYNVPHHFDLLSIDIDYNTFWVWKSLSGIYKPSIVVIEYNTSFPPPLSVVVPYDENGKWAEDNYYGASLCALDKLGKEKGYTLIYCEERGVNSFFVLDEYVHLLDIEIRDVVNIYKRGNYGDGPNGGHTENTRNQKMIEY